MQKQQLVVPYYIFVFNLIYSIFSFTYYLIIMNSKALVMNAATIQLVELNHPREERDSGWEPC